MLCSSVIIVRYNKGFTRILNQNSRASVNRMHKKCAGVWGVVVVSAWREISGFKPRPYLEI